MFRKLEEQEKKIPEMPVGWKEDGGGAKRKRMGEESSEMMKIGSEKKRKFRKFEKGVQAKISQDHNT